MQICLPQNTVHINQQLQHKVTIQLKQVIIFVLGRLGLICFLFKFRMCGQFIQMKSCIFVFISDRFPTILPGEFTNWLTYLSRP